MSTQPSTRTRARAVVVSSAWVLRQPSLLLPLAAALALPLVTVTALDGGRALDVVRGVGLLLACAWLAAVDEPSGEVLGAAPSTLALRTLARLAVAAVAVVPAWVLVAALVHWRNPWLPLAELGLEAVALGLLGVALAAGLRAWRGLHRPGQLSALGMLAVVVVLEGLPRAHAVHQQQTWGPPWEAAHLRWTALLLLGLAVLVAALRDPAAPRGRSAG